MKKTEIMKKVSGTVSRFGFQLKKHSPEILIVAGVVGTVASAVMACKATTKVNQILEEAKDDLDKVHVALERKEVNGKKYTEEDGKKDLTVVYAQTGLKFVKLYGPSVALGALSIASILTSNNILRKRNVALAAAYATVDTGFKEYRNRVVERFGKEVDRELRYNIKAREIEETIVDDNGKEKKVKKTVGVIDETTWKQGSQYARFFDDKCIGWEDNHEYNLMFLRAEQNYANDLLKARGHLFLNEVYDRLGIPRTAAGQVVGWVYDPDCVTIDNYVDFGIYDYWREGARDFVNGLQETILLDFNVDGNILKLMAEK